MKSSQKNRVRLSIEALEHRNAPAALTISPPGWIDSEPVPIVKEIKASANPGLATAEVHSGGVVQWSLDGAQGSSAKSGAGHSKDRPFHAQDSGTAVPAVLIGVFLPGTIIDANASGQATHLGAFTLHDSSMVVEEDGAVRYIEGGGELVAANGDKLSFSFTGSLDLATFTATVNLEWTGSDDGRFADATGATVWQVSLNADLTYTAVADGVINY